MTIAFPHRSECRSRQAGWSRESTKRAINKAALLRSILGTLVGVVGLLMVGACAPAATPTSTVAPAKQVATTAPAKTTEAPAAKPAATASAAAKPAATASAASKSAASTDWQSEWNRVVAAAKAEGKLVMAGPQGQGYREAMEPFHQAFPEIQVELSQVSGTAWGSKLAAEREAEKYLWDVHMGGASTILIQFVPNGYLDPLRPTFILPEVADESKWLGGFQGAFKDEARQFVFAVEAREGHKFWVNRDLVPKTELKSVDEILTDPKWKGKIAIGDPREEGTGNGAIGNIVRAYGEDAARKFLAQQEPVPSRDDRMLLEWMVRGNYPIAIGVNPVDVRDFQAQGLAKNVELVDPYHPADVTIVSGKSNLTLIKNAPHPNAAKVFINWYLSREGARAHVQNTMNNSRRVDVDPVPGFELKPGFKYFEEDWSDIHYKQTALEIAREILK